MGLSSTDHVYVARLSDGKVTRLGEGTSPAWSPDGSRLAYAGRFLSVVRADGTGRRELPGSSRPQVEGPPAWSPDGGRLAYTRIVGDESALTLVVRADGTGARLVARSGWGTGGDRGPAWSPDGRQLAFALQGPPRTPAPASPPSPSASGDLHIRIASLAAGGAGTQVADGDGARWSPDGRSLAVVSPGWLEIIVPGHHRRLVAGAVWGIAWSPDGARIALTAQLAGSLRTCLYVVGRDGSGLRRLTGEVRADSPSWSRTGQIAFATYGGIDAIGADGRHRETLVHLPGGEAHNLAWSPDGRMLAFSAAQEAHET